MINKISIFNAKNQVWESYQSETKSALSAKAQELYKDLKFSDEYKSTYLSTRIIRTLANVLSALTFLIAFYLSLEPLLGAYPAVTLGALTCITLEHLKNKLWAIQSKNILKYKKYSRYLISFLICLHVLSFGGSALGAWHLPTLINLDKFSEVTEEKTDSTIANFESRISNIDKQINTLQTKINSSTVRAAIKSLVKEKYEITKAQNLQIRRLNAQSDEQTTKREKNAKNAQIKHKKRVFVAQCSCLSIAVLFELAYVLCSLFMAFYLFRLFVDDSAELDGSTEREPKKKQSPTASAESDGSTRTHQRTIIKAFSNSDSKRRNKEPECEKIDFTKICKLDTCALPFVHRIHNQIYCSKTCRQKAHYKNKKESDF